MHIDFFRVIIVSRFVLKEMSIQINVFLLSVTLDHMVNTMNKCALKQMLQLGKQMNVQKELVSFVTTPL